MATSRSNTAETGKSTSRRTFINLMAATAATATALPAALAATDPIFEAIDIHRKAYAAFSNCFTEHARLEDTLPTSTTQTSISRWETEIVETPRWVASEKDVHELSDAEEAAAIGLVSILPTTMNGVLALLNYVVAVERAGGQWPSDLIDDGASETAQGKDWSVFLNRNLAEVLSKITA
jgi:hypothetical protein